MRTNWATLCLAFLAGSAVTLSLDPFGLWPLAIISTAILYGVFCNKALKQRFLIGLSFNLGLFLTGASWVYVSIHEFGYLAPPLAAVLTCIFCGGIAAILSLIHI